MRKIFIPVAGFILLHLSVSCSNGGSRQAKLSVPLPKPGIIHEKVACSGDPGRTYALYLPEKTANPTPPQTGKILPPPLSEKGSGTMGKRLFPVIIAFDPHGDGVLPLKLYKDLAEKYGFILLGSNDSKNGLPIEEIKGIIAALSHEVRTVYPVDTNRLYLLGFSGGARVAAIAAMYAVPVKGVIGCGAGFGGGDQPIRYKFDYFGIAGTADFNMDEMLQLEKPLSGAGLRHFIATFPGKHAWPPDGVMEDAFRWIDLNAMKDGVLNKDDMYISAVINAFDRRVKEFKSNGYLIAAADACIEAIAFLEGLAPMDKFKEELQTLEKRPDYQSQVACRIKVLKKEEEEKQELVQGLQAKNLNWWKKRIKSYDFRLTINDLKNERMNPEDTLKNKRLLSFLSHFCYMNANTAIAQQHESAAVKIIAIYEMADTANPEPNYMRAILFARRSEYQEAIGQLKIAVAKGFADKKRLTGQPEFSSMNSSPEWLDLVRNMK